MSQVAVIDTTIVGQHVPTKLAADRRRRPIETIRDGPDIEALGSQCRDALTFELGQVALPAHCIEHAHQWTAAALGLPPVTGLAPDAHPSTGLDGADAIEDQTPVLILGVEPSLPSPSSHVHSPSRSRGVATTGGTRTRR